MKSIYINESGELLLIEAPEKSEFKSDVYGGFTQEAYDQALSSAIEEGIRFKDQEETMRIILSKGYCVVKGESNILEITNGYTAEVKEFNICSGTGKYNYCEPTKVAILIPIQEKPKDEGDKIGLETMMPFIKWYSGMDESKIRKAYERYVKEVLHL